MLENLRVWLCLCLLCLALDASEAQDSSCIFQSNRTATVLVEYTYSVGNETDSERGSGFIVSDDGFVITNSHVVSPQGRPPRVTSETVTVRVGSAMAAPLQAEIVARDPANDLALLRLPARPDGRPWNAVPIADQRRLSVGAPLIALGFSQSDIALIPGGQKTADTALVDGALSPWWQTNLALNRGHSGGPVFGQLGTVVGIAVAINQGAQLVSYIIPIHRAEHLLDAAGVEPVRHASCAFFPECRDESHGVESYAVNEVIRGWGAWQAARSSAPAACGERIAGFRQSFPSSTFELIRHEEQTRRWSQQRRYFCEIRRTGIADPSPAAEPGLLIAASARRRDVGFPPVSRRPRHKLGVHG